MTAPLVTARRWRTWRAKRTAFVDWHGGAGVGDGGPFVFRPAATLADFLAQLPAEVERVYVVGARLGGPTPDELRAWLTAPAPGFEPDPAGHYLETLDTHTLRFRAVEGGRRVVLLRASSYFGDVGDHPGGYGPVTAWQAWNRLGTAVGELFRGGVLLDTPATTGRDLFARGLGERTYPVLPDEHQDLIRATTGQGRIYTVAPPFEGAEIAGLAEYDGRLMYGALCWGLGSGLAGDHVPQDGADRDQLEQDFRDNPQLRARYLVRWRVPARWDHVGLVGLWTGQGWTYPNTPGDEGESWVEGSELALMARWAWPRQILRRVSYTRAAGPGPLDSWAKKLVQLRATLRAQAGGADDEGFGLAAAGARGILLHAIGAFMGRGHTVTRSAPVGGPGSPPAGAVNVRVEGDLLVWGERRPVAWPELSHPEWAAQVWGRCRCRVLAGPGDTGALFVPASTVVAFRTDGLYLTGRHPWHDDGKAGRLRLSGWLPGPLPWPRSERELLRLRELGRAALDGS